MKDKELVQRFLEKFENVSVRRVASICFGITHDDMYRWRNGSWVRLTAAKRLALERALHQNLSAQDELITVQIKSKDFVRLQNMANVLGCSLDVAMELFQPPKDIEEAARRIREIRGL